MDARCFFIIFLVLLIEVARCENEVENIEDSESGERELRQWPWGRRQRFVCPSRFGTYADIFDCSSFYICARGRANRRNCNSGTQFDKYRKTCLSSNIAVCDKGDEIVKRTPFPVTKNDGGETSKDKFTCPSTYGNFPYPDDCSKYYFCNFNILSLKTCRSSKLFDSNEKKCRIGNKVHCGSRKRPNGGYDPTTTLLTTKKEEKDHDDSTTTLLTAKKDEKDEFTCESLHGIFPDPDDCSKYYKCTFYLKSLQTCPSSQLFDSYKKGCRRGEDVNCGSRKNPNGDVDLTTTTTTILPTTKKAEKDEFTCESSHGNFPDPDDCSKYYKCTFYIKSLQTCPNSELFDSYKKGCRRGKDVNCGSRKNPNGDDDLTTAVPTTKKEEKDQFACKNSHGNFPYPDDCSKYYRCLFYLKSLQTCPSSELFDSEKKECRRGKDVHCGSRKRPNDVDDPTTALPTTKKDEKGDDDLTTTPPTTNKDVKDQFACPSVFGKFPHPDDCSKYYFCTFFLKSIQTCPNSELFDSDKEECRRGEDVNCGSRKRPNGDDDTTTTFPTTKKDVKDETTEKITTTPISTETPTPTVPETTTPTPTEPEPETTTPTPTEPEPETTTPTPTEPEPETTTPTPTEPEPETTTPTPTEPEPTTTTTTEEPTTTKRPEVIVPDVDCDEDDVDCIIDKLGRKPKWFLCPENIGSFPHPKSKKLFIFCLNWKPSVKKCGKNLVFSEDLKTCAN